jgi:hypothetical protein
VGRAWWGGHHSTCAQTTAEARHGAIFVLMTARRISVLATILGQGQSLRYLTRDYTLSRRFKTGCKRRTAPGIHAAVRRGWTLNRTGPVLLNNVTSSVPGSRPLRTCQCTDPGYPASVRFDRTDNLARAIAVSISRSARERGRPSADPTGSLTDPTGMPSVIEVEPRRAFVVHSPHPPSVRACAARSRLVAKPSDRSRWLEARLGGCGCGDEGAGHPGLRSAPHARSLLIVAGESPLHLAKPMGHESAGCTCTSTGAYGRRRPSGRSNGSTRLCFPERFEAALKWRLCGAP